ncbi:MAG: cobalamin-binding protein [Chthonomonadales bacterium]|nr:cobalamin-binding protein [Chthonomonadales bacterium]
MALPLRPHEVFGLVKPAVDAHTLGVRAAQQLLEECGYRAVVGGERVAEAADEPSLPGSAETLERWVRSERITRLGFSYRLDPDEGAEKLGRVLHGLAERGLLAEQGGPVGAVFFAGLPPACERVAREHAGRVEVFAGDETPGETLRKLGVPAERVPADMAEHVAYDEDRMAFARGLLAAEKPHAARPVDRAGYPEFGTGRDSAVARIADAAERGLPPLMRAHVGPYLPDREAAVALFLDWTRRLAESGYLDVLSIGSSQLTQSSFGEEWGERPNGGGVPINSEAEYAAVREAARPMLTRTYAGTRDVPGLARVHERALNIAWHALSLWWFSRIDGRGPNDVRRNLTEHLETLRFIARTGKPFEPNIPHHFAFRGADDVTYVVSAVLAARAAKAAGVRHMFLQNMLNTPRPTWGVQDLARSRAMLRLTRELEDGAFRVYLETRAGLDYLSHDLDLARAQLAAVSAMMDDIEPDNPASPAIVHVVSYSEGSRLADPAVVDESVRITRAAIDEYRRLRAAGQMPHMGRHPEVMARTETLVRDARAVLREIDSSIAAPASAAGLYMIFAAGFLPVPDLWACRGEFPHAVAWRTRFSRGGVRVVDERGEPVGAAERAAAAGEIARGERSALGAAGGGRR